ncbi:bifunctional hydroxymethylpyrimidine kinase/phosphomethylpyrimidine kinase [Nicoliella lavandulae]|uniref:Hydroxymethylpyrimidine/phosphomethylpyrimidine kinase n=1 Tax=Nicoliella lavandulae TaxID=3082954 RepID=A0ABU8SMK7_9LACO
MNQYPQALSIAGFDNDGGGGMPIDLKTMSALKVYGLSVITDVVATNSMGLVAEQPLPLSFIKQQFAALTADYQIRAYKTGLLSSRALIKWVSSIARKYPSMPLIVDPVIYAKTGEKLIDDATIDYLKTTLLPLATVSTPNYQEAEKLTNIQIVDHQTMLTAARSIQLLGCNNVIIKGRNEQSKHKTDDLVLLASGEHFILPGRYLKTKRKNGTGDALSAAITAELAKGTDIKAAIIKAKRYVDQTIEHPIIVGHDHGPINHWAGQQLD